MRLVGSPWRRRREHARARFELAEIERLDEIVVGAKVQRADPVLDFRTRRQHQHRRRLFPGAQMAQDLKPVEPRQHDVEDHEIIVGKFEYVGGGLTVRLPIDGVPDLFQSPADCLPDIPRVLHQKDAHGQAVTRKISPINPADLTAFVTAW